MKTHRERLQSAIAKLQEVYDEVNILRDHSTSEMQQMYNKVRTHLPTVWGWLQEIDNRLIPDELADEEL